jgi:xylose isomerase
VQGDELVGWDTDQFPMDVKQALQTVLVIIEQGGLAPGGLNFDAKVRRVPMDTFFVFDALHSSLSCITLLVLARRRCAVSRLTWRTTLSPTLAPWTYMPRYTICVITT